MAAHIAGVDNEWVDAPSRDNQALFLSQAAHQQADPDLSSADGAGILEKNLGITMPNKHKYHTRCTREQRDGMLTSPRHSL